MKSILLLLMVVSIGTISCKNTKEITKEKEVIPENYLIKNEDTLANLHLLESYVQPEKLEGRYRIKGAKVEGNNLVISVEYGGGCREQTFELMTNGKIEDGKLKLDLIHVHNDDACRKLFTRDLQFDISQLGEKKGDLKLILNLYRGVVTY